jgi:hypothetical protein
MQATERAATKQERAAKYRHLSWFEFRARRLARDEALQGVVAVGKFEVRRVWPCISCSGPPCCPATWLIETMDAEYLEVSSWEYLLPVDEKFPGRSVTITFWPGSRRLIEGFAEGPVVVPEPSAEPLMDCGGYNEVRTIPASQVPDAIRAPSGVVG